MTFKKRHFAFIICLFFIAGLLYHFHFHKDDEVALEYLGMSEKTHPSPEAIVSVENKGNHLVLVQRYGYILPGQKVEFTTGITQNNGSYRAAILWKCAENSAVDILINKTYSFVRDEIFGEPHFHRVGISPVSRKSFSEIIPDKDLTSLINLQ